MTHHSAKIALAAILFIATLATEGCSPSDTELTPTPTRGLVGSLPGRNQTPIPKAPPATATEKGPTQTALFSPQATKTTQHQPTIVRKGGKHKNWDLVSIPYRDAVASKFKFYGQRSVEQYSHHVFACRYFTDTPPVARIILYQWEQLTWEYAPDRHGESRRHVKTRTLVDGNEVDIMWFRWQDSSHVMETFGWEAVVLVNTIRDHDANSYTVEILDQPDLTSEWDVANLLDALEIQEMTCFLNP